MNAAPFLRFLVLNTRVFVGCILAQVTLHMCVCVLTRKRARSPGCLGLPGLGVLVGRRCIWRAWHSIGLWLFSWWVRVCGGPSLPRA